MRALLTVVRFYIIMLIIWALSSWFGGFPQPIGGWLSWLMSPVQRLFGWAVIGNIYLGAVLALVVLLLLESWLKKRVEPDLSTPTKAQADRPSTADQCAPHSPPADQGTPPSPPPAQ